jgi:hypothetical protein
MAKDKRSAPSLTLTATTARTALIPTTRSVTAKLQGPVHREAVLQRRESTEKMHGRRRDRVTEGYQTFRTGRLLGAARVTVLDTMLAHANVLMFDMKASLLL